VLRDEETVQRTGDDHGRVFLVAGVVAVAVICVAAGVYFLTRSPSAEPDEEPAAVAPGPGAVVRPRASSETTSEPAGAERRPRVVEETPEAEAAPEPVAEAEAPPAAVGPLLRIESDIPGASVFINRAFVGTTPLETREIAAGSHRLNVSLEGYEGYSGTVEVAEGAAPVIVKFREVRLDASFAAVHKHRFGSCEGRLRADAREIVYETANKDDGFRAMHGDVEALEIDYLEKNLRVRLRGGRTFNFTEKSGNADALFVFQRDVERARERMAKGDAPAARN
jgi:hypothetical protein